MMDNDDDLLKDRQLLENLEKVLSGSEVDIPDGLDDDTRSALEIARKLTSLPGAPSEEFAAGLKAQLIHRLAEQERKDNPGIHSFLFWEIRNRTMWQGTVAAAIVVVIAVIVLVITLISNSG